MITIPKNQEKKMIKTKAKNINITLQENAKLLLVNIPTKTCETNITLEGKKSSALILNALITTNNKTTLTTNTTHKAQNTTSETITHSIAKKTSTATVNGKIKITPKAKHANAKWKSKTLLLGNNAKAEATPALEIETNETNATHSSTITKINETELFYMQTRGINKKKAEKIITNAHIQEIIEKIPDEKTQKKTTKIIRRMLK
jgi:Fe-S cluster assembly protein SufD